MNTVPAPLTKTAHPSCPHRRGRWSLAVAASILVASVVWPSGPAGADAGPDLALSAPSGPVGTVLELRSPDVFGMDADHCPDVNGTRTWDDDDTFEVRWELAVAAEGIIGTPVAQGSDFRYTTLPVHADRVVAAGSVETRPGVAWSTSVTVPDDVEPGERLVATASCWRLGAALPSGEQEWMTYYYLPVFTVTGPDGVVPSTAPPTQPTEPASTVPPSGGQPRPQVGPADSASPRPGTATFTG